MKSNSNIRPDVLIPLGDGSWHYNFNILQVVVKDENGEDRESFEYETVHFWGTPEYNKIVKAIIRDRYDETEEFSLLNAFNAFQLGISTEQTDKSNYEEYLTWISTIKTQVHNDLI